ncbi:hypothetical protein [Aerolutibacter ruishenii]|uniref:Uncharacterized protein n=1 Tax=Aerolutibacter ruishenii TaxID=686800 RepID=A0A562LNI8_9GAMM|nr:hypothetical protein [Lysobacter ruishenii]TWI09181.1 hypothetical protein IP93_02344 [Lysobacter ruishenii]
MSIECPDRPRTFAQIDVLRREIGGADKKIFGPRWLSRCIVDDGAKPLRRMCLRGTNFLGAMMKTPRKKSF